MPLLTNDEKALLQDAISIYLQLIQQKMGPAEAEKFYGVAQQLVQKLEDAEAGGAPAGGVKKPRGISDEWFEHCCRSCDKFSPAGQCLDKITEKYPGKCDPILIYERNKPRKP